MIHGPGFELLATDANWTVRGGLILVNPSNQTSQRILKPLPSGDHRGLLCLSLGLLSLSLISRSAFFTGSRASIRVRMNCFCLCPTPGFGEMYRTLPCSYRYTDLRQLHFFFVSRNRHRACSPLSDGQGLNAERFWSRGSGDLRHGNSVPHFSNFSAKPIIEVLSH